MLIYKKGVDKMSRTKTDYTKDILKLELAQQLGYGDKIRQAGWGELTSAESGRLGGMVNGYMRKHQWI